MLTNALSNSLSYAKKCINVSINTLFNSYLMHYNVLTFVSKGALNVKFNQWFSILP